MPARFASPPAAVHDLVKPAVTGQGADLAFERRTLLWSINHHRRPRGGGSGVGHRQWFPDDLARRCLRVRWRPDLTGAALRGDGGNIRANGPVSLRSRIHDTTRDRRPGFRTPGNAFLRRGRGGLHDRCRRQRGDCRLGDPLRHGGDSGIARVLDLDPPEGDRIRDPPLRGGGMEGCRLPGPGHDGGLPLMLVLAGAAPSGWSPASTREWCW
jgi:hypothetical protein